MVECPGYGPHIRWAGGAAVRRNYGGHQAVVETARGTEDVLPTLGQAPHGDVASWSHVTVEVNKLVSAATSPAEVYELVSYYAREIAGKMVWIDSEHNKFRRLVIPLARTQPVLLLAIMAVAAEHQDILRGLSSDRAKEACDIAISKITDILQSLNSNGTACASRRSEKLDFTTIEWLLAAMLILSNYECVDHVSTVWRLHRQGARALIKSVKGEDVSARELFRFLRDQSACHDVLASTTTAQRSTMALDVMLPERGDTDGMFVDYLHQVHEVDRFSHAPPSTRGEFMDVETLRMKFDVACGDTLIAAGKSHDLLGSERHDFICLVDVYHYAALLYAYRCVYGFGSSHPDMIMTLRLLFEKLEHFKDIKLSAHNLPWPLFIAGVESYGDKARQDEVADLFEMIVVTTGFGNFGMVRAFLKNFWEGEESDWRVAVVEWETMGRYILSV
jgi:hypothetical protein